MVPKILPDGTKEFDLTAFEFPWQLYSGEVIQAWGYNRQVPGPLIRVKVGDKVAIVHCHILDYAENPSAAGDGSVTQMAEMGGLMTFINVSGVKRRTSETPRRNEPLA